MTIDKLISEMDKALQFPGVSNAWTMPIKARIDMLATGIRTPVGVKVLGRTSTSSRSWHARSRQRSRRCPARPAPSPSASSAATIWRSSPTATQLARYGLMVGDVQQVIASALGAETVTTTVEGRERYARQPALSARRALRPARNRPRGARAACRTGPRYRWRRSRPSSWCRARPRSAPRTRSSRPISSSMRATAISAATSPMPRQAVAQKVKFPPGYYAVWSGQFEYLRARQAAPHDRRSADAAHHSSCCSISISAA